MAFLPEILDDDTTTKISMTMMINLEAVDIPLNMSRVMVETNGRLDRPLAWTQRLITRMTTVIAIEDVRREVKILQALTGHRNLVQCYDCYENDNVYVVMELCKGGVENTQKRMQRLSWSKF
ncbi:unnamed protein product [Camellia sinensis]